MQHPYRIKSANEKTSMLEAPRGTSSRPSIICTNQPTNSSSTSPRISQKGAVIPLYCANTHMVLSSCPAPSFIGTPLYWDRNDHAEHIACVGLSVYLEGLSAVPYFAANSVGGLIKGKNGKKERNRVSRPCFVPWCKPGSLYPWLPRTTVRPLYKVIIAVWLGTSTRLPFNPPQLFVSYNRNTIHLWGKGDRGALQGPIISVGDRMWSCKKIAAAAMALRAACSGIINKNAHTLYNTQCGRNLWLEGCGY